MTLLDLQHLAQWSSYWFAAAVVCWTCYCGLAWILDRLETRRQQQFLAQPVRDETARKVFNAVVSLRGVGRIQ